MIIRDEGPTDRSAIYNVVKSAFGRAPEAELVDRLRADGDSVISFVAVKSDEIVGHILFSRMSAPFRSLGLAPVSALPAHHNAGIGSSLIREGLVRAKKDGWQGVFVLGNPEYYRRFGFTPQLASGFSSPYAGPEFMALALNGELPITQGRIGYASAFASLD